MVAAPIVYFIKQTLIIFFELLSPINIFYDTNNVFMVI